MNILDCTLRDGGYYNNWDFDEALVRKYINALIESGVTHVELGLRNFPKAGYLGPYAYTTDSYIKTLDLPTSLNYGVMVDAKTIIDSPLSTENAISALFTHKRDSEINFVRIAAHYHEIPETKAIASKLASLGYIVGLNLMQSSEKSESEIKLAVREIATWTSISVLYFADSLGNMDSTDVERIVNAIRANWTGDIGIHTHDNMGNGLSNSLKAISLGVTWIDATVTGMGRGAGNTQTERLVAALGIPTSASNALFELAVQDFEPMQRLYGWGSSLLYFLAAQNKIHPTYIQNLIGTPNLQKKDILQAFSFIAKQENTQKYTGELFHAAITLESNTKPPGGVPIHGMFKDKEVLVLANSESTSKHRRALELYIKEKKPVTISVNINRCIDPSLISITAISRNFKFLSEGKDYNSINNKVLLPCSRFSSKELTSLSTEKKIDYGISIEKGVFSALDTNCILPFDLTFGYVMAAAIAGGASNISLAGFDGYDNNDERQLQMNELFSLISKHTNKEISITALTPSSYPIRKSSIYAYI